MVVFKSWRDKFLKFSVNRRIETTARKVANYTPQLFKVVDFANRKAAPYASGLLVKVGSFRFLISTAHSLYDQKQLGRVQIGIVVNSNLVIPKAKIKITEFKKEFKGNENIDLLTCPF